MTLAAILLAAQQAIFTPTTAPVTPSSVTTPKYDVACQMRDTEGQPFEIGFRQTGGRGYSRSAVRAGEMGVGWTQIEVVVTKDSSGRYQGEKLWTAGASQRGWPGIKQTLPVPGRPFQTQFVSVETDKPDRILLQVQSKWPLGEVSSYGLCSVRHQAQSPLSDEEARRQISQ